MVGLWIRISQGYMYIRCVCSHTEYLNICGTVEHVAFKNIDGLCCHDSQVRLLCSSPDFSLPSRLASAIIPFRVEPAPSIVPTPTVRLSLPSQPAQGICRLRTFAPINGLWHRSLLGGQQAFTKNSIDALHTVPPYEPNTLL